MPDMRKPLCSCRPSLSISEFLALPAHRLVFWPLLLTIFCSLFHACCLGIPNFNSPCYYFFFTALRLYSLPRLLLAVLKTIKTRIRWLDLPQPALSAVSHVHSIRECS